MATYETRFATSEYRRRISGTNAPCSVWTTAGQLEGRRQRRERRVHVEHVESLGIPVGVQGVDRVERRIVDQL
jgi:hypothetical protein